MSDGPPQGISRQQYRRRCEALGREPGELLSPVAREAALPAWLTDELIATPASVAKLQAWAQQCRPAPDRLELFSQLHFIGDEALCWLACGVLAHRIPAPVTRYALDRCRFIAVASGDSGVLGFCMPSEPARQPWTIVLSDVRDAGQRFYELVAHEVGHSWLLDEPAPDSEVRNAFETMTVRSTRLERVPEPARAAVRQLRVDDDRYERQAQALVKCWGFSGLM